MFSIRDFKRLYHKVNVSEPEALKQLLTAILPLAYHKVNVSSRKR